MPEQEDKPVEQTDNQFSLPQEAIEELRTEFITAGGIVTALPDVSTVRDNTQVQIKKTDADGNTRFDIYQMIGGKWYFLTDVAEIKLHAEGSSEQYETTQTITILVMGDVYEITEGWSNHYLHNMTNGSGIFTITQAGDYFISWTLSIHSSAPNEIYECGLLVDGVNVQVAWSHLTLGGTGDVGSFGASTIYRLRAGQKVSIGIANTTSTADPVIDHASFSVFRIR